jgi:lipoate---protein ligase
VLSYRRSPELEGVRRSFYYVLGILREALRPFHPEIELAGISDLIVGGRKFSGNSQQRKRSHLLHHGTILYNFDISRIVRYLPMPARRPNYRAERDHAAFLTNFPSTAPVLKERICAAWNATRPIADWPSDLARELVCKKYSRGEWIRRF